MSKKLSNSLFRNFIFGAEDSLVSTVGLLSGVAIANTPAKTIILAGIVLIFVEAFSMGVGSFLSEHSIFNSSQHNRHSHLILIKNSLVMFFSYLFAGFIPLLPYILFDTKNAFPLSIALALSFLFVLGVISAKKYHNRILTKGLEMLVMGGIAITLGIAVGAITNSLE